MFKVNPFVLLCAVSILLLLGIITAATGRIDLWSPSLSPTVTPTTILNKSTPMSLTIELPETLPIEGCRVEISFLELPEASYLSKVYFNPPDTGELDPYLVKRFAIYGGGEGLAREQPHLSISISGELIQQVESRGENRLVIIPESVLGDPIENHGLVVTDVAIRPL